MFDWLIAVAALANSVAIGFLLAEQARNRRRVAALAAAGIGTVEALEMLTSVTRSNSETIYDLLKGKHNA